MSRNATATHPAHRVRRIAEDHPGKIRRNELRKVEEARRAGAIKAKLEFFEEDFSD